MSTDLMSDYQHKLLYLYPRVFITWIVKIPKFKTTFKPCKGITNSYLSGINIRFNVATKGMILEKRIFREWTSVVVMFIKELT